MAVVLEFLQTRYTRKQRHFDNRQVQLSEFSARRNAARTVHGLTPTSSNYDAAVEMLQERYGKPHIIISVHIEDSAMCRRRTTWSVTICLRQNLRAR